MQASARARHERTPIAVRYAHTIGVRFFGSSHEKSPAERLSFLRGEPKRE